MPRRKFTVAFGIAIAFFILFAAGAGIFLFEITIHPYTQLLLKGQAVDISAQPVFIDTPEGLRLRAWYRASRLSNGGCVTVPRHR